MTQWRLRRRGRTVGPIPTSELLRALQLGKVPIDSEAQKVGEDDWAPLAEFPEFAEEVARDTPTHIMSAPWFLEPAVRSDKSSPPRPDPSDIGLESTPLPLPAALQGEAPGVLNSARPTGDPPPPARPPQATIMQATPAAVLGSGELSSAPGFSPTDSEPITPRVPHPVVPADAVPPVTGVGESTATETKSDPGPWDEAGALQSGVPAPGVRAPIRVPPPPPVPRPSQPSAAGARAAGARPVVSASPSPPRRSDSHSADPVTVSDADPTEAAELLAFDELQDAVSDSDAGFSEVPVLTAVEAPLGPNLQNRVESHGPAPMPRPAGPAAIAHQETTSPAVRVYAPDSTSGRSVLWILVLVLATALGAAIYAILAR